jgi:hypothetical protein
MRKNLLKSRPKLKWCYFFGYRFKPGSRRLKIALNKWYKKNAPIKSINP